MASAENTDKLSQVNETPSAASGAGGAVLEWTVHPVTRRPWASAAVSLFVILVTAAVFYSTASRTFAVLALVVMLLSLAKFYFPTRYRMDEKGVTVKTTTQTITKPWSQFRSCYPDKNGLLLSPFPEPSRLENFRGLYVMFQDNRSQVTEFARTHIGGKGATGVTAEGSEPKAGV